MKVTIAFDRLRWEEKELKKEAEAAGCETELLDARPLALDISKKKMKNAYGDVVLQRCISYYRSSFLTMILENYGVPVVNTTAVSDACGNKMITTMLLAKAGVPTPKTFVALSEDGAVEAGRAVGFPVVVKPFVGSWGRNISMARDEQTLATIIELKESIPNPLEHMHYLQEYVKRPPRDIRVVVAGDEIVAAEYRHAPDNDWRTNVARGGTASPLAPDNELSEMVLKAAAAVGGGVLGVDAMESDGSYMIHEVNNTVEFHGAQAVSKTKIARRIMAYVIKSVKK